MIQISSYFKLEVVDFFETESCYIASGCPETDYVAQAASNLWSSCLRLLTAGIADICHHAWLK
jgi:hypothetical protein